MDTLEGPLGLPRDLIRVSLAAVAGLVLILGVVVSAVVGPLPMFEPLRRGLHGYPATAAPITATTVAVSPARPAAIPPPGTMIARRSRPAATGAAPARGVPSVPRDGGAVPTPPRVRPLPVVVAPPLAAVLPTPSSMPQSSVLTSAPTSVPTSAPTSDPTSTEDTPTTDATTDPGESTLTSPDAAVPEAASSDPTSTAGGRHRGRHHQD